MPPPEAVAGTYVGPDGKKISVPGLSEEDKLTLVRWIDLGCAQGFSALAHSCDVCCGEAVVPAAAADRGRANIAAHGYSHCGALLVGA